jgi:membrane-associated protease RseP (regulator of RpoE activity)
MRTNPIVRQQVERRVMSSRNSKFGASLLAATVALLLTGSLVQAQEKRGFLGVILQECSDCKRTESDSGIVVWHFGTPPRLTWVYEESPAALAGLREGDVIVAVQGVNITTEEGGRLFGAMRLGEPVEFRVRRGTREATIVVTPGTLADAFGEEYAAVAFAPKWDSVRVQLRIMYEGLPQLQIALKEAEEALARTEAEGRLRQAETQRVQIDSMNRQLEKWYKEVRIYTDSLAARTLLVKPRVAPEVDVQVLPAPEAGRIKTYSDAVAGARFKTLKEDSPLAEYFGVTSGLLVTELVENTPAHTAGLREGDVVLEVNGQSVASVSQLRKLLHATDKAKLTYVRKGEKQTCTIPSKKK